MEDKDKLIKKAHKELEAKIKKDIENIPGMVYYNIEFKHKNTCPDFGHVIITLIFSVGKTLSKTKIKNILKNEYIERVQDVHYFEWLTKIKISDQEVRMSYF